MSFQQPLPGSMTSIPHELFQTFNSALLASQGADTPSAATELDSLMESRELRAILFAVQSLAASEGVSHADASAAVIRAFRKLDRAWSALLIQEGIEKLRSSGIALEN